MQNERLSLVSGVIRTIGLPITDDQIEAWESGQDLHKAMPNLTDKQTQFILNGTIDINSDPFYKEEYLPEDEFDYFSD